MTTISPHIFILAIFLSILWSVYLAYTIWDYHRVRTTSTERRRGDLIATFRRLLVAVCVFSGPFSLVFRTGAILLGLEDAVVGQVTFFALLGPNVVGSIFAATTAIDEWRANRRNRR